MGSHESFDQDAGLRTREAPGVGRRGAIPTAPREQTAIVVKALTREDRALDDPFAEITELCRTAGARVVETIAQKVDRISSATYIGRGKAEEAAQRAAELDADIVVTDNDLSPAQERNLEKLFQRTVIDRTQLILDIFAGRASTLQARLQVEMAQLRYTFPRLKRMWTHLSRYEGGIGMRGPGETQLETDKRLIQRRIRILQRKLDAIERRREHRLARGKRDLAIALVGYTNAGKSTLLNRLTDSHELVEDRLFATLDTRTRRWPIDGNRHVLLSDTVGFIRQLPHHLVASFHATLAETQSADILLHVVDAGAPDARRQIRTVEQVLRQIECDGTPCWLVLNKWDRVEEDRGVEARTLHSLVPSGTPVFEVSAATGHGLEELRRAVAERLDRDSRVVSLVIPHRRGDLLAYVRRHGRVLRESFAESGARVRVEMDPVAIERLRAELPEALENGDGTGDGTGGRDGNGSDGGSAAG